MRKVVSHRSGWARFLAEGLVLASSLLIATVAAGEGVAMREKVYEKLGRAQQATEQERWEDAFEILDQVAKMKDLEPIEKAQLHTAYGYAYFAQEKYTQSVSHYEQVLDEEGLPDAMVATTLYTLAQLSFQQEDYGKAVEFLQRWLNTASNPGPEPFVLLAQAHYQLEQYREVAEPMERALAIAEERGQAPHESWYGLLRAVFYELDDRAKLLDVLEILVTKFPRKEYWTHLASVYGEMGDERRQLAAYEVAYEQGYLVTGAELRLLAQLLMQAQVPYRAGVVLEQGLASGAIEATAENWRLLSQAWMLAHENARAIEALGQAASLSPDGEVDARLAQSHANLGHWADVVDAAREALRKGVKREHEVQLLLGMALFELDRYDEAKAAFREAQKSAEGRENATRWLAHVENEERRLRELESSLQ